LGASHRRTATATSAEGAALAGLGHTADAEKLLLDGLSALRSDPGALPFVVDNATRWTADYYRKQGKLQEAARYQAMLQGKRNR